MIINDKFKYPILKRVDTDIGRHYLDSNNKPVPSVTTVLSGTSKSKDGLLQWRIRVGEEEAERIIKQSTDIGTAVHEAIENYLNGKSWDNFEDSHDQLLAKRISNKFIKDGLKGINDIWGLEVGLVLDNLYAGTADCVGEYEGIPTLIDFKTAKKIKIKTIGFLGSEGGESLKHCDLAFIVPSNKTARIQEVHITAGHALIEYVEARLIEEGFLSLK